MTSMKEQVGMDIVKSSKDLMNFADSCISLKRMKGELPELTEGQIIEFMRGIIASDRKLYGELDKMEFLEKLYPQETFVIDPIEEMEKTCIISRRELSEAIANNREDKSKWAKIHTKNLVELRKMRETEKFKYA